MKRMLPVIGIAIVFLILGYVFSALIRLNSLQGIGFVLAGLALGIALGFILAWLLEEFYRRNQELERLLQNARQQTRVTHTNLPDIAAGDDSRQIVSQALADFLRQRDDEIKELRIELDGTEEKVTAVQKKFEAYAKTHPDDLTVIKGIGPVYQWKLKDIGINTFQQLAEADPDHLRRMLDVKNWQKVAIESWISQANDWVKQL